MSSFFYSTQKTQNLDRIGPLKGGPLGIFQNQLSQNIKKIEEGPFAENFQKISLTMPKKKQKGGPFGLARYCTLLIFEFLVPTSPIFVEICRTILVSSYGLKKLTIMVTFHFMKRRLKKKPSYFCWRKQMLRGNVSFVKRSTPIQTPKLSRIHKATRRPEVCKAGSLDLIYTSYVFNEAFVK